MKKFLLFFIAAQFAVSTLAQINYSTSFTGCNSAACSGWNISGGYSPNITSTTGTGYSPCNTSSAKSNIYGSSSSTTLYSQSSLGTSTGATATLSFNGKAIDYSSGAATPAGSATITAYWATASTGPWHTISSQTNVSSTTCNVYTFSSFTPTTGLPIFIKFTAVRTSGDFWMVIDDISLIQGASNQCSGTPNPGNTISSAGSVCPGANFNLSLQYIIEGTGITYQWQYSPNGIDSWTNFGTSAASVQTSQTSAQYYRCQVTCTNSGMTGSSTPVPVGINGWFNCYCTCASTNSTYENIGGVIVTGGISNIGTPGSTYSDYSALTALATPGNIITVTIIKGSTNWYNEDSAYVFIDYNQDGDFTDAGELAGWANGISSPYIISINTPVSAIYGITRMRIKFGDGTYGADPIPNLNNSPCQVYTYGETEDYAINFVPPSSMNGYVYDYDGQTVANALVEVDGGISTTSGPDGYYNLTPLVPGLTTFICSNTTYVTVTEEIDIPQFTAVNHNFTLLNPEMAADPASLFTILGPTESETDNLTLTNDGSGPLEWTAEVQLTSLNLNASPHNDAVEYCAASGGCDEFISRVQLNTIDNSSECLQYYDYTSISTGLIPGTEYTLTVTVGPPVYSADIVRAWIDYNQNGVFDDGFISFPMITVSSTTTGYSVTGTFIVPETGIYGPTRLRVRLDYNNNSPNPCGTTLYGEVEDYTVRIIDTRYVKLDTYSGTIPPFGGTQNLQVTIDASKTPPSMAPGESYQANIIFNASVGLEPDTVPVTLIVTDGSLKGPQELTPYIVDEGQGKFMLKWKYFTIREMVFDHFEIYDGGTLVGTTIFSYFDLKLTEPGNFCYRVYAVYQGDVYSDPSNQVCIQYPLAPGVPVAGWALGLGALLIVGFSIFMIKRRT
jgi:hypothetical protein